MAKPSFFSPCDLAIALTTIPTLAGLVVMKSLGDMVIDLGLTSEEVFRGDRLPILNMPNMSPSSETPE
ncbi:MAG: hypothetical protein WBA57_03325 [Elainellaceae cyanobacterium]